MTEELESLIYDMEDEWRAKFEEGAYEDGWDMCMEAWNLLPEPKYREPVSRTVAEDIVKYSIKTGRLEYADRFISFLFICDTDREDYGKREYWAGRLAYERGNINIAKELFACSLEKSKGCGIMNEKENRVFQELVSG